MMYGVDTAVMITWLPYCNATMLEGQKMDSSDVWIERSFWGLLFILLTNQLVMMVVEDYLPYFFRMCRKRYTHCLCV